MPRRDNTTALVGADQNNCGFHCLIHALFNKPIDEIRAIARSYPESFNLLTRKFNDTYGTNITAVQLIDLVKNRVTHPIDRELLLGSVMRGVLNEHYNQTRVERVVNDELEDNDIVTIANLFGANVNMTLTGGQYAGTSTDLSAIYLLGREMVSRWNINMFNNPLAASGHYEVNLGSNELNSTHNAQIGVSDPSNPGRLLPAIERDAPLFTRTRDIIGINERVHSMGGYIRDLLLSPRSDDISTDISSRASETTSVSSASPTVPASAGISGGISAEPQQKPHNFIMRILLSIVNFFKNIFGLNSQDNSRVTARDSSLLPAPATYIQRRSSGICDAEARARSDVRNRSSQVPQYGSTDDSRSRRP